MRFKDKTVNPSRISPELLLGLCVCESVMQDAGGEVVLTSLNDGKHSTTSCHYSGNGADIRSWCFEKPFAVFEECKKALADHPDYDLIYEKPGQVGEHFHLEYQPKRRAHHDN